MPAIAPSPIPAITTTVHPRTHTCYHYYHLSPLPPPLSPPPLSLPPPPPPFTPAPTPAITRSAEVFELYLTDYSNALEQNWEPPPDGLPDPEADDSPLNYHLDTVDLIAMCAKGDNKVTEDFAQGMFSLSDMMLVLTTVPDDATWKQAKGWSQWREANRVGSVFEADDGDPTGGDDDSPERGEPLSQLPLLMRSPFLRLLHGIFFSVSVGTDEEDVGAKTVPVFKHQLDKLVKLFAGMVKDIQDLTKLVKLEDEIEKREQEEQEQQEAGEAPHDEVEGKEADGHLAWKDNENSRYEYHITLEEHVFWVAIPFLFDFLQVASTPSGRRQHAVSTPSARHQHAISTPSVISTSSACHQSSAGGQHAVGMSSVISMSSACHQSSSVVISHQHVATMA